MKRNRYKKIVATIAVTIVAASFVACSKVSPERLESIAKSLKADTVDIDELDDVKKEELKDGIFIKASGDDLEDYMDDLKDKTGSSEITAQMMDSFDIDDIIKLKKVDEYAAYISGEVSEDNKDILSESVMIFKMEDKDSALEVFDNLTDKLKDNSDLEIDKLSKDEFENGKKFVMNLDTDDVTDIVGDIIDNTMSSKLGPLAGLGDVKKSAKEMKKQLRQELGDDFRLVTALYIKNDMIIVVQGTTVSDDFDKLPEITSKLGISDPLKVKNSEELIEGLGTYEIDIDVSSFGRFGEGSN